MNAILLMLAAHLAIMSSQFGSNIQVSDDVWSSYKLKYDKQYSGIAEEALRRQVLAFNIQKIQSFNEENPERGFRLGVNQYADLTEEELRSLGGMQVASDFSGGSLDQVNIEDLIDLNEPVPDHVDWRDVKGVVSEVKNMGYRCHAGWAIATAGLLEGQLRFKTMSNNSQVPDNGGLIDLSAQELIDCDTVSIGCFGGNIVNALNLVKQNGGIQSERDYPFKGKSWICRPDKKKNVVNVKSFTELTRADEDLLKRAVASYGPVGAIINASSYFWLYNIGILDDPVCGEEVPEMSHGVLIVGYGTDENEKDYWIVKNSSGPKFGEDGYVRMIRNKKNHCGIAQHAIVAGIQ